MILLCGIPSETPMRLVRDHLDALGAKYVVFNQRNVADCEIQFEVNRGQVIGRLRLGKETHSLDTFRAIYTRLMDDRSLPELAEAPPDSPARNYCRGFHDVLNHWMEMPALRGRSTPLTRTICAHSQRSIPGIRISSSFRIPSEPTCRRGCLRTMSLSNPAL